MYNKIIIDLLKNPINAGGLQGSDCIGKYENPVTNEVYKLYIKLNESKDYVEESRFKTLGNPYAIAVSSIFTEIIKGKAIDELLTITNKDIETKIGEIPNDKLYCVSDILLCLNNAVKDYMKKLEKMIKLNENS